MLFQTKANRIILLGLNEISINLARKLSLKDDVVILDNKSELEYNTPEADVIIENFEEGLISTLNNLQINNTACFLAVTEDDEYNLFVADLGKKLGAKRAAAMVHNFDYAVMKSDIDLIFNPHQIFIDQISSSIRDIRLLNIKNLIPGKVNISKLIVKDEDPFSYLRTKDLDLEEGLIIAVQQGNRIILPEPDLKLFPGDQLYILFKRGMVSSLLKIFKKYKPKKRLFILGGGDLGLMMINCWENMFEPIIVIEPDLEQCNLLAGKLEKILIIHGEGTDLQLLKEEGLDKSSVFLAISRDDLQNLLSSFGAKNIGCNKVITLLYHSAYKDMAGLLNLDNVFSLPDLVADYVINFIRTGLKLNKYILGDDIYTTQITVGEDTLLVNRKIADLQLPRGILIGVIIRENEVIIPGGDTYLLPGDNLIIFFYRKLEDRIYNIFKSRGK